MRIAFSRNLVLRYTRTKNHKLIAKKIPVKDQIWIDARKQFQLSDAHIQMARELGMNPKKFNSHLWYEGKYCKENRK